jgi:hypothetical protein
MFAKFSTLVPTLLSRFKASDPPPTQNNAASVRDASDLVTLSLISHTNAGKTTLARTLLRKDVGEVRDAPHVTLFNESHLLLETGGFMLRLWDTPGFGDSARLMKRLKRERNPVLWFLSQTWDRITDRPLWCSQQALKNVREEADVVLYQAGADPHQNDPLGGWMTTTQLRERDALVFETARARGAARRRARTDGRTRQSCTMRCLRWGRA